MSKTAILAFALVVCVAATAHAFSAPEAESLFEQWTAEHGKTYASMAVRAHRFEVFAKNLDMIRRHNMDTTKSYTLAMNEFGDLTHEEFKQQYLSPVDMKANEVRREMYRAAGAAGPSKDWRSEGAVTGVKNQKSCGSCWAFSSTGCMEGAWQIKSGDLVALSEQQLMDCSTSYGNMGCNGGLMSAAFDYVLANGGIESEKDYPYKGHDGSCHADNSKIAASFTSYRNITQGSEAGLTDAVFNQGPVAVAIDASHMSFQFYHKGVYNEKHCSSTQLDHGVLAVGYDTTSDGKPYYIVKNSWGSSWGNHGYLWMTRDGSNQCGIATMASVISA